MWVLLIIGIFLVIIGIGVVVNFSINHENNSIWFLGVIAACILIALGIFLISCFSNQMDPPSPVTDQGHIYKVFDSMEFKKGYLVSFKEIIPNKKKMQVRFFEKMPPSIFESAWENGKIVYIHFEPPSPN